METRSYAEKLEAISNLYQCLSIGQCMVFCRSCVVANAIAETLTELGQNVAQLHGELEPAQRLATIEGFRYGRQTEGDDGNDDNERVFRGYRYYSGVVGDQF